MATFTVNFLRRSERRFKKDSLVIVAEWTTFTCLVLCTTIATKLFFQSPSHLISSMENVFKVQDWKKKLTAYAHVWKLYIMLLQTLAVKMLDMVESVL